MATRISRYGRDWTVPIDDPVGSDLAVELACIKEGYPKFNLSDHMERARRILWPNLDGDHNGQRWHTLCRNEICRKNSKVTVLMGPKSSGKTHEAAWISLVRYFANPDNTCILVSSTDIRGLRMRVWGEISTLWQEAIERFDWLPGHYLDSKLAITTDTIQDGEMKDRTVRDMRKGIVGIPCILNGKFVGLGKYAGIKQKHVMLVADEAQFMGASFLSAFSNLDGNEDFQAIVLGNPNEFLDPLGKAAEPKEGWSRHMDPQKTECWDTNFMGGRCVNLIGPDSPNFDFPADKPTRFKYLISREKIQTTLSFFHKDSLEYYSQCVGAMRIGVLSRRVITRDLVRQFHAQDDIVWLGEPTIKVAALDAAYGGDRCVCGHVEFGKDISGKIKLFVHPPVIVPVLVKRGVKEPMSEEYQIADYVKDYCVQRGIPASNFYHDSTGRGSLGTALARVWSDECNPVEFGGAPTDRPVSLDTYINDEKTGTRRLKKWSEHVRKFVTELWFATRYVIEADQMRGLPEEVLEEGCMREWNVTKDDKKELETKAEMKERSGRSPDLYDWLSIAVEGARRRGFQISKLSNESQSEASLEWLHQLRIKSDRFVKSRTLAFSR